MAAAKKNWFKLQRGTQVKSTCAFWTVKLVRTEGNKISVELVYPIKGFLGKPLHRVRMKQDAAFPAKRANLCDRLDGSNLVVGRHDRDQNRILAQRGANRVNADSTFRIDRQVSHIEAFFMEKVFARMQDSVVLDGGRDDMPALFAAKSCRAKHREVV